MASGFDDPPPTLLLTVATAPATTPRNAVAAVESFDGFGGGLRSRRRLTAAARAATFFLAVPLAFFRIPLRVVFRVIFDLRAGRLVAFFAKLTSATSACTRDADHIRD